MLDVRRMKVLREVAAQGSFSAAAEALNFTQSAVSQHVAALERETGTRLVERLSRGVRLTEAGAVLVEHADAIITRLESAEDDLAAIAGLRGGSLKLVCFQSAGATVVPRAVAAFHERHPEVELSMREAEPEEAARMLKAGEVDLALLYHHPAMTLIPDLELTHLMDDCYDALLPAAHPLAKRRRLALRDLADESWIVSTPINGCRTITSVDLPRGGLRAARGVRGRRHARIPGAGGRQRRRHDDAAHGADGHAPGHRRPGAERRAAPPRARRPHGGRLPLPGERRDARRSSKTRPPSFSGPRLELAAS